MRFTGFSQGNRRWGDLGLGTGGGLSISQAGCTLCGLASVLDSFGVDTDPGRLNRWLARNRGFTSGNLLVFDAVERLGAQLVAVIDCWNSPAPMDEVEDHVGLGRGVLALVDFKPGGTVQQHWVRLLRRESDDWLVMDPWLDTWEECYYLLARYAVPTWDDAARAVFRLAVYEPTGSADKVTTRPTSPAAQGVTRPVQRAVCRRPGAWRLQVGGLRVEIGRIGR